MEIKIIQKHKSINPPCEFEFPEFSVLTGKNGSGKTVFIFLGINLICTVFTTESSIENIYYNVF